MLIISEALAQLKKTNHGTSNYHSTLPTPNSQDLIPSSSPTLIDPTFSSTSLTSKVSSDSPKIMQQQEEEGDKIDSTAINPGDSVHVLWSDSTPGNFDIFYKRDGADFDPTTINLSNNAGTSSEPVIAVSGNNIHVAWEDNTPGNVEIFYRRSFDGGATFGPIINLSENAGLSSRPAVAVSGNNVHVVWDDNTPGNSAIFYKRSTDGGASFTEPTKNLSGNAGFSRFPAIAVSGNNVHVVWGDDGTSENGEILYRRSLDGGSTFPNIIKNLSGNAGVSSSPAIAVSSNNVHVVWDDSTPGNDDILYRRSLDGGDTFPNVIKNLSSSMGTSFDAAIAVSGNNVHVVWSDTTSGNSDILYRRSLDGGTTFPNVIKNLSSNTGFSFSPAITLSSNNVYVVWEDNTIGNFDILYRTSSDNGDTFPSLLTNLSVNDEDSDSPSIAATFSSTSSSKDSSDTTPTAIQQKDEGEDKMHVTSISSGKAVHTIWSDDTPGNSEIFYKRDGADFDPTTLNLSNNVGFSGDAEIAVSGNNVHVVWNDNNNIPGNFDIMYRRSFDGGATFGPIINLSNDVGGSAAPAIAVSGNSVHVVWQDSATTDIHYRRSIDSGALFGPTLNLSNNAGSMSAGPKIAVSDNIVHVVWHDPAPGAIDILYRRSTNGGASFTEPIKNLSGNSGESSFSAIAVSGNSVHVVWRDQTSGNHDIFYRRSLDGGSTFPNIIKNLSGTGFSTAPSIAASSNNVHVVWGDGTSGNNDILYRRSLDGGTTFPNVIKNLSSNTGVSASPAITLSSNNVYVVWLDGTGTGNVTWDILYRTSSDNGATFPSLLTNLSVSDGFSSSPAIAAS